MAAIFSSCWASSAGVSCNGGWSLLICMTLFQCIWQLTYWQPNFVRPSGTMFGLIKSGKLLNIIMHNVIRANQKTDFLVFCWLCAHAMFDVTCFPAFVKQRMLFQTIWQYINSKGACTRYYESASQVFFLLTNANLPYNVQKIRYSSTLNLLQEIKKPCYLTI